MEKTCRDVCGMACQCCYPGDEQTKPESCVHYKELMRYWHSEEAARAEYLLRLRDDPEDEWIGGDECNGEDACEI